MPKTKKCHDPLATPESPRKTPKKEFSSPRKADSAGDRSTSRHRNGQSPSPIRRPKPKFKLDNDETVATGDSGIKLESSYLDMMPGSPPVFEGLVKLKEKKVKKNVKKEASSDDDRVDEENTKQDKSHLQDVKSSTDSPHKIYLRKDKKDKKSLKVPKKVKKKSKKIEKDDDITYNSGSKITDFFDVRRSSRKPAKQIENERNALWRKLIRSKTIDGLEVRDVPFKGRGVFNTKLFQKDDFVVEYSGDLIDPKVAATRDDMYSEDSKYGSYMYYFVHKGTKWCIDATIESGKLGRLLNHSCKIANCATRIIEVDDLPRLVIYAKHDIPKDNELLYDYGDRGKISLEAHPWLKE